MVLLLVAVVAACGSGGGSGADVSSGGGDDAEWVSQVLDGQSGADQPTQIAVDGNQAVVVTVSDDGVITGFATDDQGRFQAGEPTATGWQFLGLGGVTRLGDGWVTVGSGGLVDDELLFEVHAFGSGDGRTWSELDTTGLGGPADVLDVVTVDGVLVAAGALRTADDPSEGGFGPVAWRSEDGERWTTVALSAGDGAEGSIHGLAVVGDEVLAVGTVDGRGTMWSSTDRGASWTILEPDGVPAARSWDDVTAQGDVIVASGIALADGDDDEGSQLLIRSTDEGRSWGSAADPPPANRRQDFALPISVGGGRFFALRSSFVDAFTEAELCYADIDLCRQDSTVTVYVSDDGDVWERVDTSGITGDEAAADVDVDIDAITATDDGRVVVLARVPSGTGTWTWPAGTPLRTGDEPVDPSTDVEMLGEGDEPQIGRRYGVPLYIHCGMDWLYVGGEAWQRTDNGPDIESGAGDHIPDHWPVAQQTIFGFATLVRSDLIEYSIGDNEVIATYAPATQDPPGCE